MPSTYTTNLGIEKIATGEQSGTWGTTTNTNFDLIDTAVNGIVSIILASAGTSGSPNDLPINDGTASNGRNKFIEFVDGGDLGATAYVQLTPNDAEKIVHIRNSLSGSRSIIVFQGTYNASNDFEIPNGADVTLKFDGAGTGATVTDVNVDLTVTGATIATADINGGTIDGTVIGGSSAAAGTFTTFTSTGIDDNATSTAITIDSSERTSFASASNRPIAAVSTDTNAFVVFQDTNTASIGHVKIGSETDDMVFYANAQERMRIKGGNVGIGETSPARALDVNAGTSNVVARFASTDFTAGLVLEDDNGTPDSVILNCEAGAFTIDVGGGDNGAGASEAMRIDSSGLVGIGTTSPGKLLDLAATNTSSTVSNVLRFTDLDTAVVSGQYCGLIEFYASDGGNVSSSIGAEYAGSAAGSSLVFSTNATAATATNTERMRIDASGHVKIGDTAATPDGLLSIRSDSDAHAISIYEPVGANENWQIGVNANGDLGFYDSGSTTASITFQDGGNVGIGWSVPDCPIFVTNGDAATTADRLVARFFSYSATGTRDRGLEIYNGINGSRANASVTYNAESGGSTGQHVWQTDGTERMRIDSSGNVGIGTDSPAELLHVYEASTNAARMRLGNTDGYIEFGTNNQVSNIDSQTHTFRNEAGSTEYMRIDSSGRVGIGTTNPSNTLTVNKDTGSTPTVYINNSGVDATDGPALKVQASGRGAGIADVSVFSVHNNSDEIFTVRNDGNVGIGTATPTFSTGSGLEIQRTSATATLRLEYTGANGYELSAESGQVTYNSVSSLPHVFEIGSSEKMRIDSSGNVGIGVIPATGWNTGYDALQIGQGAAIMSSGATEELFLNMNAKWASDSSWKYIADGAAAVLSMDQSTPFKFRYAASGTENTNISLSEAMRIDSSGNLLVGTTSSVTTGSEGIELRGDFGYFKTARNNTGSTGHWLIYNPNGNVGSVTTSGTSTQYNTSSDVRLKENIVDAPAGNIDAIRVRSFDWKADGSHQTYGMVAQELVDVAPEAVVQGETEDDMWGVDYSKLVPMMIKEIQDLKAEVAALKGA